LSGILLLNADNKGTRKVSADSIKNERIFKMCNWGAMKQTTYTAGNLVSDLIPKYSLITRIIT
jgi:hypothetical protein